MQTSTLTSTIKQLSTLRNMRLIGSQYYGNIKVTSDYDYQTMHYNINKLLDIGFNPLINKYDNDYYLDNLTSEVLRKPVLDCVGNINHIDIQICNSVSNFNKKWFLHSYIKDRYLYQLPKVYFRNLVWEMSNLLYNTQKSDDPLYCTVHNLFKEYIVDMSVKRFFMICNETLHTNKITPLIKPESFILYPNYNIFAFMWQLKFGV